MNKLLPLLLFSTSFLTVQGQSADYSEDVSSIDHIIAALYASISGDKGVERDWDRFHYLFAEGAQLIPTRITEEGVSIQPWSPSAYVERVEEWFLANGFFEQEISRKTDQFGHIAQVFSTYTSRHTEEGEIFARGINSIQLLHDGERWYVVNIFWQGESEKFPIPEAYLKDEE